VELVLSMFKVLLLKISQETMRHIALLVLLLHALPLILLLTQQVTMEFFQLFLVQILVITTALIAHSALANPGVEYQTVFYNLYNSVKADPDEILINGADRKQLSDSIKNGSTANYRLNLTQTEAGDYVGGATIGALYNEITGKMVPLTVHPWLEQGVSPVLSYTLPIPDTEVSDVWSVINVQDYMGIQWPVVQFSYDFSTYFRGTFFCYAPAWNGAVSGIVHV